jgi:hypothetical protein
VERIPFGGFLGSMLEGKVASPYMRSFPTAAEEAFKRGNISFHDPFVALPKLGGEVRSHTQVVGVGSTWVSHPTLVPFFKGW